MAENINKTLEQLATAIDAAVECCEAGGSRQGQEADEPGKGSGDVSIGPNGQFEDQADYNNAKCNAANAIFDQIKAQVDWLDQNNAGLFLGIFGGIIGGLTLAALSGPLGWATIAVGAVLVTIAASLLGSAVDFGDMSAALADTHDEAVTGLYNAGSTTAARASFISAVEAGTPTITSNESDLISLMLANKLLNELYTPADETANYMSPDPVTCGTTLAIWTFISSFESWTFADISDPGGLAVRSHDPVGEKIACQLTGDELWSRGNHISPTVSIAVGPGNSVQFDYPNSSDGLNYVKEINVFYDDARSFNKTKTNNSGPGTLTLDISESGTIERVEIITRRGDSTPQRRNYDIEVGVLEVRIQ